MRPDHWARVEPTRPAIVMGATGNVTSYSDLAARSCQLARFFRDMGLERGDHVAVVLENCPQFFEVLWAALHSGVYFTPVNRHLTSDEVGYILDDCEARIVISSATLAGTTTAIDWEQLPRVRARLMVGGSPPGFEDYDATLDSYEPTPLADASTGSLMLYTSGTTGRPKGVLPPLSTAQGEDPDPALLGVAARFGFDEHSVYLSPAPMYHAAPLLFTLPVHTLGGTVVVMEKFDAAAALHLIESLRVTHSQWVPTMLIRLLGLPDDERLGRDLSSHRMAIHAAAPCPHDVKRRMIEWWGPILTEYYAGTDSGGMTIIDSAEWLDHPGSVGRGNVRIIDDDGNQLPPGEIGTVYFAGGPDLVYKGDPDKTAAACLPGGLRTAGDCGYLDEGGWLYLTDRRDFMINSGGVNIYPREVEDVLLVHPAVSDVAVFGVPNREFGEEVKAVVQLVPTAVASDELAADIIDHCRLELARFKCPRSVDFVEELPRSPTGKLMKRLLRAEYRDEPQLGFSSIGEPGGDS
ncbi:MAG: acyl-CoA synthetase [Acidimicrobiales bacterium]